jgi:NAD(P)-dependent dehydrogenase (short-subunit alcohol dehydrogenase family)
LYGISNNDVRFWLIIRRMERIILFAQAPITGAEQRRTIMTIKANRVAVVTGASGGIGAAVAERLARDGFTVVVNYAGSSAAAAAVVTRIEAAGGRAVAAQADISDVAEVARLFDSAETAFGGVDVLINNAGIMISRPSPTAVMRCSIATSRST